MLQQRVEQCWRRESTATSCSSSVGRSGVATPKEGSAAHPWSPSGFHVNVAVRLCSRCGSGSGGCKSRGSSGRPTEDELKGCRQQMERVTSDMRVQVHVAQVAGTMLCERWSEVGFSLSVSSPRRFWVPLFPPATVLTIAQHSHKQRAVTRKVHSICSIRLCHCASK